MDFSNLNDAERRHMEQLVERKQMKDFVRMYSSLVERCFIDCIDDFTSKAVSSKENTCVDRCITKFLRHSARVGQQFAEENAKLMQQ
ncbi:putative TIM9-translocase of the mitochondrial inner membrane [Syncephalis pseudoplumigaleata]|uniref:Mitochondrial import inner membrane translocase subunit n=1 Tax=Syncephalis pseudoplumigaleata TaxID=1712513 RepID=A0A4V1J1H1_9FUNG|nr:putative TIM9-translocase of the mitochondrial inner membrane [Syncephalis pseudoplumigaleata]RKP26345.1 putative TIM9-translocase of the mitochondrial inner membrane [Syncephalis pseudoplumigaleata]|eukprot:RKP25039.1 putative TIM9-translocase of the mitochondrial inner membrane [Syncephalis pseudoplumigaleata]